jgi:hypothetical protein
MTLFVQVLIGVFGVAVSVGLFFIGYRQTIGAYKERVRSANSSVETILIRRIILESYTPSLQDVSRIIEANSREYKVRQRDLWSESQVLNTIVTRIMENDFIRPKLRKEIFSRLSPLFVTAEQKPVQELILEEGKTRPAIRWAYLSVAMGIAASVIGALFSYITANRLISWTVAGVFVTSLALIFILFAMTKAREGQEEPSAEKAARSGIDFERQVEKAVHEAGAKLIAGPVDKGFDFLVEVEGKRLLIETKAWTRPIPMPILGRLIQQLNEAVGKSKADQAIIVTKESIGMAGGIVGDSKVLIMSLRELRNFLAHGKR